MAAKPIISRKRSALGALLHVFGMKAAHDEIIRTAVKRQHEPESGAAIKVRGDTHVESILLEVLRPDKIAIVALG